MPKQSNMRHKISINTIVFVCVGHLLLGMEPALQCGLYTSWDSLGKTDFSSAKTYWLEIAQSGMGTYAHLPLSGLRLIWLDQCKPYAGYHILCELISAESYCAQKSRFSWCHSSHLVLIIFFSSYPAYLPNSWGLGFMKASIPLRKICSKVSQCLYFVQLLVSVFALIYYRKKFSNDGWVRWGTFKQFKQTLIYTSYI